MNTFNVGNIITLGKRHDTGDPIEWIVAHVMEDGNKILITKDKYADMMFDAPEPDNPIEYRKNYGNNRWSVSNIRQWLNSDKPANEWYDPMYAYDEAPDYASQNGFLFNFTESEKQIIVPKTNLQVVPSGDNDGANDTTVDSVWLPSMTEYFGWANNNIMEGEQFEWFKTKENRNHSSNIFNSPWMRSANVGNTYYVHCLYSDGSSYGYYIASARLGVRPGIVIRGNITKAYSTEMDKIDANQITELVLSKLFVDTFDNYNKDKEKIVTSINGYDIGYRHDGKTLTHDIFIELSDHLNGGLYTKVTGDIRSGREQLAARVSKLLNDVLSKKF